ncbi:MAG: hypothetical protein ACI835_005366 [Planctomycetota bacterium]|jgi:hypothetical protein
MDPEARSRSPRDWLTGGGVALDRGEIADARGHEIGGAGSRPSSSPQGWYGVDTKTAAKALLWRRKFVSIDRALLPEAL